MYQNMARSVELGSRADPDIHSVIARYLQTGATPHHPWHHYHLNRN